MIEFIESPPIGERNGDDPEEITVKKDSIEIGYIRFNDEDPYSDGWYFAEKISEQTYRPTFLSGFQELEACKQEVQIWAIAEEILSED